MGVYFLFSLSLSLFLYVYTVEGCRVLQCYVTGDDMGLQATGFQKRVETAHVFASGVLGCLLRALGLGFRAGVEGRI